MSIDDLLQLSEDRHQQALYRLAAVEQYLYDTMNGNAESDRDSSDPLPLLAMEPLREAQRFIGLAIQNGQRSRRECLGGHLVLVEREGSAKQPESDRRCAALRVALVETVSVCNAMREYAPMLNLAAERALRNALAVAEGDRA